MTESTPKPYDRLEGEPNRWYDRFHEYMRMGANRNFARVYRQVVNKERALTGRPPLSPSAQCPRLWRQRARQYDWDSRAEAWDDEQRRISLETVERTLRMAQDLAPEALLIERDVMRGKLTNPDGSLTEGQNCTQRRLAAENILDRAGVIHEPTEDHAGEDDDDPGVIGIVIHRNPPDEDDEDRGDQNDQDDDDDQDDIND